MALPCKCENPVIKHLDGDFPICETCNRVVCNIIKQMKLTERCAEDFKYWYLTQDYCILGIQEYGKESVYKMFLAMDDSFKFGVLTDFFEQRKIYINISNDFYQNGVNHLWQVFVYEPNLFDCVSNDSTGGYGDNGDYDLSSSRIASIERADMIYNKLYTE